jgi:hypothetical protein
VELTGCRRIPDSVLRYLEIEYPRVFFNCEDEDDFSSVYDSGDEHENNYDDDDDDSDNDDDDDDDDDGHEAFVALTGDEEEGYLIDLSYIEVDD